nr:AAA family ATPase [Caulobacteraceae bacterium]
MLIGLGIRDIVLIDGLDLSFGPGLTVLTGETGTGKSIILDCLGLAAGARGEAALLRRGAVQGAATAIFAPAPGHPAWAYLDDKGLSPAPDEDLVLRRTLAADGRTRAFVNDQQAGVGVLRDLGALLIEIHGQHDAVGLLDSRTHRALLDGFSGRGQDLSSCQEAWNRWRVARERADSLEAGRARATLEAEDLGLRLAELDRLAPREGEEDALARERAVLGAAEQALAEISIARDHLGGTSVASHLAHALRAVERARERILQAGGGPEAAAVKRLAAAAETVDRALIEATEAASALDAAAEAFEVEPDRLEKAEERLFALRAFARKLNVPVNDLPRERAALAARLLAMEDA